MTQSSFVFSGVWKSRIKKRKDFYLRTKSYDWSAGQRTTSLKWMTFTTSRRKKTFLIIWKISLSISCSTVKKCVERNNFNPLNLTFKVEFKATTRWWANWIESYCKTLDHDWTNLTSFGSFATFCPSSRNLIWTWNTFRTSSLLIFFVTWHGRLLVRRKN